MKVAVFQSDDEIIILQVKGNKTDWRSVDGFEQFFLCDDDAGQCTGLRKVEDYDVTLCHLGAKDGIVITPSVRFRSFTRENDISDWFYEY